MRKRPLFMELESCRFKNVLCKSPYLTSLVKVSTLDKNYYYNKKNDSTTWKSLVAVRTTNSKMVELNVVETQELMLYQMEQ